MPGERDRITNPERLAGELMDGVDAIAGSRRSRDPLCARAWKWVRVLAAIEMLHAGPDIGRAFGVPIPAITLHAGPAAAETEAAQAPEASAGVP